MPARYAHINIVARDWRALADFYMAAFGCEPVLPERDLAGAWLDAATGLEGARLRGIHLRLPGHGEQGPTLEIFQYEEAAARAAPAVANRLGYAHVAFAVDDVGAALERVLELGGARLGSLSRTTIPGAGPLELVYALDPEGNVIELQRWGG
jgi:glyoxylase I family protein